MECPHLRDSVKVNRDFIKNIKCELSNLNSGNRATTDSTLNSNSGILWKCSGKWRIWVFVDPFLELMKTFWFFLEISSANLFFTAA